MAIHMISLNDLNELTGGHAAELINNPSGLAAANTAVDFIKESWADIGRLAALAQIKEGVIECSKELEDECYSRVVKNCRRYSLYHQLPAKRALEKLKEENLYADTLGGLLEWDVGITSLIGMLDIFSIIRMLRSTGIPLNRFTDVKLTDEMWLEAIDNAVLNSNQRVYFSGEWVDHICSLSHTVHNMLILQSVAQLRADSTLSSADAFEYAGLQQKVKEQGKEITKLKRQLSSLTARHEAVKETSRNARSALSVARREHAKELKETATRERQACMDEIQELRRSLSEKEHLISDLLKANEELQMKLKHVAPKIEETVSSGGRVYGRASASAPN